MLERIGIAGASGCRVTTLGAALAARLGAVRSDTNDHYRVATDPPYPQQRGVPRASAESARSRRKRDA